MGSFCERSCRKTPGFGRTRRFAFVTCSPSHTSGCLSGTRTVVHRFCCRLYCKNNQLVSLSRQLVDMSTEYVFTAVLPYSCGATPEKVRGNPMTTETCRRPTDPTIHDVQLVYARSLRTSSTRRALRHHGAREAWRVHACTIAVIPGGVGKEFVQQLRLMILSPLRAHACATKAIFPRTPTETLPAFQRMLW